MKWILILFFLCEQYQSLLNPIIIFRTTTKKIIGRNFEEDYIVYNPSQQNITKKDKSEE